MGKPEPGRLTTVSLLHHRVHGYDTTRLHPSVAHSKDLLHESRTSDGPRARCSVVSLSSRLELRASGTCQTDRHDQNRYRTFAMPSRQGGPFAAHLR